MATLKISDLSVGDWVNSEDKAYRLYAIEECGLLRGKWEDDENLAHIAKNIDYFDPIPITPEILEANGFVKNGEYNEWNIGTWQTPYLLGVSLERPAITIKWNGSSIFIDQAKYVHQLQNALRLAGVDKEIVMPNK